MSMSRLPRARLVVSGAAMALTLMLAACETGPKDPTAGMSPEKLYESAREDITAGQYEKAAKTLERLEGRAAGTLLAQQAMLEQAWALYKSQERAQALSVIERYLKLHPSSPGVDYAYYLQGLLNFNEDLGLFSSISRQDLSERDQQASKDAYQSFRTLIERFPDSKYAPDARARMAYIVHSLAAYEVHVARYYFTRGAYVAAANRAQSAVAEFQQSPAIEEALYIMGESYDKLGLTQLRDDARRVLDKNFPDSQYASNSTAKKEPWWKVWKHLPW